MKMRVFIAWAAGIVALGACMSNDVQQVAREQRQRDFEDQRQRDMAIGRQACDLRGQTGVSAVVGKIPLSGPEWHNFTMSMLTLDRTPTPEERLAIEAADHADLTICKPAKDAFLRKYDVLNEIVALGNAADAAGRSVLADLYMGKLTYAQANRQMQSIQVGQDEAIAQVTAAYYARQAARMADAQAAAQAQMDSFMQTYINSLPRTTTTTCIGGNGYANCTTR